MIRPWTLRICPTDDFAEVEGAPCRVWQGVDDLGQEYWVYTRLVTAREQEGQAVLDAVLDSGTVTVRVEPLT